MLNFLRKKKIQVPDNYKNLIGQSDYEIFLNQCLKILKDLGVDVISYENGDITYKGKNEDSHYFLDNLVRKYVQVDKEYQLTEIKDHFKKLQETPNAYDYLFKDFDYAKQFLKALIKPADIIPKIDDFVTRIDYPNLLTVLVLDFEDRFHYIRKDEANLWDVDYEILFKIALDNISQENVEIRKHIFDDKYDVYVLLSGDFSASFSLLLDTHMDFAIGEYGSLIGIPTKGTVFIHPITSNDFMDMTSTFYHEIEKFYNEDPSNISTDLYWFDKKSLKLFNKTRNDNDTITISMPDELKKNVNE